MKQKKIEQSILEGLDYIKNARESTHEVMDELLGINYETFAANYLGRHPKKNQIQLFKIPNMADKIPGTSDLVLGIHPYDDYNKARMYNDPKHPMLVIFEGDVPKTLKDCFDTFQKSIGSEPELYIHELVHLFDGSTFDKPMKPYKPSAKSLQKENDKLVDMNPQNEQKADIRIRQYVNSPTEINARVVAGIDDSINKGAIGSFDEFKANFLEHEGIKTNLNNTNPTVFTDDVYKRVMKILFKFYENTIK